MSNQHTIEADRVAKEGAEAGEKLWAVIELAYQSGLQRLTHTFECALEQISDQMTGGFSEARDLFFASAMKAIRLNVDSPRRRRIDDDAANTYARYVRALEDDETAQVGDHRSRAA